MVVLCDLVDKIYGPPPGFPHIMPILKRRLLTAATLEKFRDFFRWYSLTEIYVIETSSEF